MPMFDAWSADDVSKVIGALVALVTAIGAVVAAVQARGAKKQGEDNQAAIKHAHASAERSAEAAELTASKTAAIQQALMAHCGTICPAAICPLRRREEQTVP